MKENGKRGADNHLPTTSKYASGQLKTESWSLTFTFQDITYKVSDCFSLKFGSPKDDLPRVSLCTALAINNQKQNILEWTKHQQEPITTESAAFVFFLLTSAGLLWADAGLLSPPVTEAKFSQNNVCAKLKKFTRREMTKICL